MNFADVDFSHQSSSDIHTNQFGQEHRINRQKTILRIGFITTLISLFLALIISLIYFITRKQYCIDDINSKTISTKGIYTSTTNQLLTTLDLNKTQERNIVLNPCIELDVEYTKWGIPIQNYSLYSIDASLLMSNTLIYIKIALYPSVIDCSWSLNVFPMDGTIIPTSGRPPNSLFGYFDQSQNIIVEKSNVSTLAFFGGGTGKFIIGITGAWYGSGDVGCQGYGKIKICFSHP